MIAEECPFAFTSSMKSEDATQEMKASMNEIEVPIEIHKKPPINPAIPTPMYMNVFITPRAKPFSSDGTVFSAMVVVK